MKSREAPLIAVIMLSCDVDRARKAVAAIHECDAEKLTRENRRNEWVPAMSVVTVSCNGDVATNQERYAGRRSPGDFTILDPSPFNYSRHNNHAARATQEWLGYQPEFFCFINDDIIVRPGWLEDMLECHLTEDAAAVGMKLVYPPDALPFLAGRIQHCGVERGPLRNGSHIGTGADPDAGPFTSPAHRRVWSVTGACMLVSAAQFWSYGPFDEEYEEECQDTDLCQRLKEGGGDVFVVQNNYCYHEEMATRGSASPSTLVTGDVDGTVASMRSLQQRLRDTARFVERWGI